MQTFGFPEFLFLLRSAGWTVLLTAVAFALGGIGGGALAVMRLSQWRWLRNLAATYILVIQSIPVLMVLLISYYGISMMGLELPPFGAASLSLAIYVSAYLAEIWRGCIESVPYQQWEASSSLALSRYQQYRYVILPQAVRIALPPTAGFGVQVVKNTSIVSVVGFVELARAGTLINNSTYQPFIIFPIVAVMYFLICFPLSRFSRHLEKVLHASRRN